MNRHYKIKNTFQNHSSDNLLTSPLLVFFTNKRSHVKSEHAAMSTKRYDNYFKFNFDQNLLSASVGLLVKNTNKG